ncbi:MAG: DUF72 domain-containing protein [Candidatus Promineifilaceae bacterium]
MTDWYLGTMGFGYKEWVGPFYPDGLQARHHLAYYAERFNGLEIDSTFYGVPKASTVERWRDVTPQGFRICPKMPQSITHEARLVGAEEETYQFLERMRLLQQKLGPILIQFPPDFTRDEVGSLIHFLPQLPQDLRFAVEFRHRSWLKPETGVLLQAHNLCWVSADTIYVPRQITPTTDFLYLRFIGPHGRFATKDRLELDRSAELETWWQELQPLLATVRVAYAFFNDDYEGFSPETCNRFKRIIGLEPGEIRPMQQGRLF